MSRTWPRILALALLAAGAVGIAGCHNVPAETQALQRRLGIYQFSERVRPPDAGQSASVDLEGRFVVLQDTVTVEDATTGTCSLNAGVSRSGIISYDCGDAMLSFDRQNPVEGATYTIVLKYTATQQVCVRYITDAQGRQVCAETANEPVQRQAIERGHIRAIRVSSGGA